MFRQDLQDEQDRKPILSILFILSLFFCGKPHQCLIYDTFYANSVKTWSISY